MNIQLEKARNEVRDAVLCNIESKEDLIKWYESSIDKYRSTDLPICDKWRNEVITIRAIISQLEARYNELLKLG